MFAAVAAKRTHCPADTTTTIEDGNSVVAYGIYAEGTAAGQVVVNEGDDATLIGNISVQQDDTTGWHTPFRADNGLVITTPVNVTAIVFHSHTGT